MNVYPTIITAPGSDLKPLSKLEIDRAVDGTARVRSFYSADKYEGQIEHNLITLEQKETLDAFYLDNRLSEFTYVSPADGSTRTMIFKEPPSYKREAGAYWTAKVSMEEV